QEGQQRREAQEPVAIEADLLDAGGAAPDLGETLGGVGVLVGGAEVHLERGREDIAADFAGQILQPREARLEAAGRLLGGHVPGPGDGLVADERAAQGGDLLFGSARLEIDLHLRLPRQLIGDLAEIEGDEEEHPEDIERHAYRERGEQGERGMTHEAVPGLDEAVPQGLERPRHAAASPPGSSRPFARVRTRRAILLMRSRSWVATRTVVPCALISLNSSTIWSDRSGSRLPVGSSARRSSGRFTRAR